MEVSPIVAFLHVFCNAYLFYSGFAFTYRGRTRAPVYLKLRQTAPLPHDEKEMVRKEPFDKIFNYNWD